MLVCPFFVTSYKSLDEINPLTMPTWHLKWINSFHKNKARLMYNIIIHNHVIERHYANYLLKLKGNYLYKI